MKIKDILEKKSNRDKVEVALKKSKEFLQKLGEKYPSLEEFLSDEKNILDVRRASLSFVKEHFKNLNKWNIRELSADLFSQMNINMEEESSEKFIFLLFTDAICEVKPESVPLVFFYNGYPLIKKHGIVLDFDILPFMIQTAEEISPEKKHKLVLTVYPEDSLVLKGISKHLSEINFFILNLLDKVLYKEIIPFDRLVTKKGNRLEPELESIRLSIKAIFSGLIEKFLHEKEKISGLLSKDYIAYFTKIKNYIKKTLEDKEEIEYLLETAKADEESIENRILAIRDYENQKNVFEESKKREDVPIPEKIESVFWLLGIENTNPVLLFRFYDTDDILYFLHDILKQAQDEGFLTEEFKEGIEHFLLKIFQYPYLSKGFINKKALDKPIKILFDDNKLLKANYYYFTRRYREFLDLEKDIKEKTPELRLKQLLSKFFEKEFDKDELIGWLSLEKSKEGQFFYHLFTNTLEQIPQDNQYSYVADLYTVKASHEDIFNIIGEEGTYTLILRLLGFYPYDKTLLNLSQHLFSI